MAGQSDRSYTGVVSLLVLGVAFTGLFLGVEDWWVAFIVGYGVIVPLVSMLTGEEEVGETESTENTGDSVRRGRGESRRSRDASKGDALDTLRDRYARGELSDAQFESKLERLLETETLEDARASVDGLRDESTDSDSATDDSRAREFEYE